MSNLTAADADEWAKLLRRHALEAVASQSPRWREFTLLAVAWSTRAALLRLEERKAMARGGPKE